MTFHQIPEAQGMYNPEFEHDACGIGLYAHIKGNATHDIVKKGLEMLCRLRSSCGTWKRWSNGRWCRINGPNPRCLFSCCIVTNGNYRKKEHMA